jgi:hypothetical protein
LDRAWTATINAQTLRVPLGCAAGGIAMPAQRPFANGNDRAERPHLRTFSRMLLCSKWFDAGVGSLAMSDFSQCRPAGQDAGMIGMLDRMQQLAINQNVNGWLIGAVSPNNRHHAFTVITDRDVNNNFITCLHGLFLRLRRDRLDKAGRTSVTGSDAKRRR